MLLENNENKIGGLILLCAVGIMLIIYSVQDIISKKVNLFLLLFIIPVIIAGMFIKVKINWWDCILGVLFGLLLFCFSKCTRGKFGCGDAIVLGVIGLAIGILGCLFVLFFGLVTALVYVVFLFMRRKLKKNLKIPLMPFLLAGYIMFLIYV